MKSLEERMKNYYESRVKQYLPRRSYVIIRIDGKSFHTYTKGLKRPFDQQLVEDFDKTAMHLCENVEGCKLAYLQGDEISLLLTDFDNLHTEAWFDNEVQKLCSVSASLATAYFNYYRHENKLACFDSRCFTIPSKTEVINYFIWRQKDCVRNSISMTALSLYSQKEVMGKNQNELQEMCWQKGVNWNDFDPKLKRGRLIKKVYDENGRGDWQVEAPPTFTQDWDYLDNLIIEND